MPCLPTMEDDIDIINPTRETIALLTDLFLKPEGFCVDGRKFYMTKMDYSGGRGLCRFAVHSIGVGHGKHINREEFFKIINHQPQERRNS